MGNLHPYRIAIIAPTCFYYQAPLFRALAADSRMDLTVYFCTDEGISGKDTKAAYGTDESWAPKDDLMEGYRSKFLRNHAPWGSYLRSLVGLANLGIWKELRRNRPDAVVVMSWMNPTWWLTYLACLKLGIPMLFMTDANVHAEVLKSPWKSWLKRVALGKLLFPAISGFLCAGTSNRELYVSYGVPDEKLFPFAYSWGYASLIEDSKWLRSQKSALRTEYGLPQDAVVLLYCGRLSAEKGSIELINAYKMVSQPEKALVVVGDGKLRKPMQELADAQDIDSVYFMGFQNRDNIGKFYALADILVLPSREETWGMVVNEGLCFSLPVIVSDQVGSGADLVIPEENGYVFPSNDVGALAEGMSKMIELPDEDRVKMGERSQRLITEWSNRDLSAAFVEYFGSIGLRKQGRFARLSLRRLALRVYRSLPDWIALAVALIFVGTIWTAGIIFLVFRLVLHRFQVTLKRFRP